MEQRDSSWLYVCTCLCMLCVSDVCLCVYMSVSYVCICIYGPMCVCVFVSCVHVRMSVFLCLCVCTSWMLELQEVA